MINFTEYCQLKENPLDNGTPSSDLRMARPGNYNSEHQYWIVSQLQNPKNKDAVAKVLAEHPEMAKKLADMLKQAILQTSNIDYHGMSDDKMSNLNKSAGQKANNIVNSITSG